MTRTSIVVTPGRLCRIRTRFTVRLGCHDGMAGPLMMIRVMGHGPIAAGASLLPEPLNWADSRRPGPRRRRAPSSASQ
eukprot:757470-Hanusia_phi.AAC.1